MPDTAAYLLISVFPQLPITLFLGYFQEILFPVDYILGSIMLVFLVSSFSSVIIYYLLLRASSFVVILCTRLFNTSSGIIQSVCSFKAKLLCFYGYVKKRNKMYVFISGVVII